MRSLVVLIAVVAVAFAAPSGTVEKRSIGHAVAYSVPAAVSHQSRVDVHSSPAVVAEAVVEPVVAAPAVYAAPAATVYAAPAATVYAAPAATVYAGGSAVSHQSRVDVHSSPAVVATAPVVAEPVVEARAVYAAPAAAVYAAPAAVSHQSRVDVRSSPAVVEHVAYPTVVEARSLWAPSVYSSW